MTDMRELRARAKALGFRVHKHRDGYKAFSIHNEDAAYFGPIEAIAEFLGMIESGRIVITTPAAHR